MRLWRVSHRDHVADAWSGQGARLKGGRWNSPGRAAVYASEHAALAVVELLAYVRPQDLRMFRLVSGQLPDAYVAMQPPDGIPDGWDAHPHGRASRGIGDAWIERNVSVGLKVPSCLVPGLNVLLNPNHSEFRRFVPDAVAHEIPLAQRAPQP